MTVSFEQAWERTMATLGPAEPSPYANDPVFWLGDRLGESSWSKSYEILEALRDHRRVAVHSAHDLSKSWTAARGCVWWIEAHPIGTAMFLTTAPSWSQVRAILWQEIADCHAKAKMMGRIKAEEGAHIDDPTLPLDLGLPGRVNQSEWWVGSKLVGLGRKPAAYSPSSLQGFHSEHLLIVVDEAGGIPLWLWEQFEKMLTNEGSKILVIGNPDAERSQFHRVTLSPNWHTIHLDGLDSPNFTGEKVDPKLSRVLLSQQWVDEVVAEHGEDSRLYISGVRGLFPPEDAQTLIPYRWAEACADPSIVDHVSPIPHPVHLGVDIGETGDRTVIAERRGPFVGRWWRLNTNDSEEIIDVIIDAIRVTDATVVTIDSAGVGFAVFGGVRARVARDRTLRGKVIVLESRAAWRAEDEEHFVNWRAEQWWEMRELVRNRQLALGPYDSDADPETGCSPDVLEQIAAPRYGEEPATGSGHAKRVQRIFIEPKDDIVERLGFSPDDAEALINAFVTPTRRSSTTIRSYRRARSTRRR